MRHGLIVIATRPKLSVVAALIAVLMTAGPTLDARVLHGACADRLQVCGEIARLTHCCWRDREDASNTPGVTEARMDVRADDTSVAILPIVTGLSSMMSPGPHVSFPLLARRPDLPILFVDLRI